MFRSHPETRYAQSGILNTAQVQVLIKRLFCGGDKKTEQGSSRRTKYSKSSNVITIDSENTGRFDEAKTVTALAQQGKVEEFTSLRYSSLIYANL